MKAGYEARIADIGAFLHDIYDISHRASTGPAVKDTYWEIYEFAREGLFSAPFALDALAAHDKAVKKAALLEAAEKYRTANPSVYDELHRIAKEML